MKFINPFIQENQSRMAAFLSQLCVVPLDEETTPSSSTIIAQGEAVVSEDEYRVAITFLRGWCSKNSITYGASLDDEFENVESRQSAA